jgi:hypothetical protein
MNPADDSTLLIAPRWIAPVEPLDTVLCDHAVVVRHGRIEAVLPAAEAARRHPDARSVALPGHLLVPGLVNLHTHAAMSLLRGAADDLPLEPNLSEFDEAMWAALAHRIPAFEAVRVERAWAGYYEMNLFDHNALLGVHPGFENLLCITGFSGHGMQQAPAAGRGIAELIVHGRYASLDLSELNVSRLMEGRRVMEANVIG